MTLCQRFLIRAIDRYRTRGGGQAYFRVACNFEPGCSAYARQAVERFGAVRGVILTLRRIRRCRHPDLAEKIADPVPVRRH